MKKKLILCSSLAALSLATVLSLSSCGGITTSDVNYVKSDILDTTLVSDTVESNTYTKFDTYYGNVTDSGNYIYNKSENKIYNYLTGKSITVDNLSNYAISYKSVNVSGYGYIYLLYLSENSSTGTKNNILYDNNLEKVAEFTSSTYSSLDVYINTQNSKEDLYNVSIQYIYYDYDYVNHIESFNLNANKKTGFVTIGQASSSTKKDSKSYGYTKWSDNVYCKTSYNKENYTFNFYNSSYEELCQLETNVEFEFSLEFKDKLYIQGFRDVAEDYKNAITVYQKGKYYYYEVKTYCVDLNNKKAKEIDTEVLFVTDCKGNKDSDYFVANYAKIDKNFVDSTYKYTGFFKDGELEYNLPITINSVEAGVKKIGDDYLIQSNDFKNLYNKDMEAIKSVSKLNKYNIYSDNKNFKTNFYKANGDLLYSTENTVDTSDIETYGLAYESKDGKVIKALVFSDGSIKTVSIGENDDLQSGLIITDNLNDSYTIKQPGSNASLTVYGDDNPYLYSNTTNNVRYYEFYYGIYYLDSAHTNRVTGFVGRK